MAGTTRLELATSAVTVSWLQVLSTTWKSTDGTASHWKYTMRIAIVYRDVYRASSDLGRRECVSADVEAIADEIRVR